MSTSTFKSRANPDGPRAMTRKSSEKFGELVLDYFYSHDELNGPKVLALLGEITDKATLDLLGEVTLSRVKHRIDRMKGEGLIHSRIFYEDGRRIALYSLGPGDDTKIETTKQRMVSKWKPHAKPDPFALPTAFFRGQQ